MKKMFFVFIIPIFAWSQNLQELVELSIQNRLVEASSKNIEAIEKEYESVQSGYLPKLDVGANYAIADKETSATPSNSFRTYASLNYVLYDGGRKYDIYNSYESNIKSREQQHNSLKNEISLDVTNLYFNYLSFTAQKDAKQKEIEQLQSQYSRLSNFFAVGSVTKDELEKIVSRVEAANVELHEIELNIQTILHNLEYIAGQKVSIDMGSLLKDISNLHDKELRYDIKALGHDLETLLSNANAEKSGYYPTITLDNTFTYYENDYDNAFYDTGLDNQNILSANLSWNVFAFGQTKELYESRYKEYLSLKSEYEYEKNKADIDLQLAKRGYDISLLKLESAKSSLKAADSTYEIVKSQYENGLVDNVAFLESLSEKYNALSVLEEAKNDLEIKKAEIIFHSGKDLIGYIQ